MSIIFTRTSTFGAVKLHRHQRTRRSGCRHKYPEPHLRSQHGAKVQTWHQRADGRLHMTPGLRQNEADVDRDTEDWLRIGPRLSRASGHDGALVVWSTVRLPIRVPCKLEQTQQRCARGVVGSGTSLVP